MRRKVCTVERSGVLAEILAVTPLNTLSFSLVSTKTIVEQEDEPLDIAVMFLRFSQIFPLYSRAKMLALSGIYIAHGPFRVGTLKAGPRGSVRKVRSFCRQW